MNDSDTLSDLRQAPGPGSLLHAYGTGAPLELRLTQESVDAVARRVVELLGARASPALEPTLLTAEQLARRHGVSRAWVYAHAQELGVIRLGGGPRARLRFDANVASERLAPRSASGRSQSPRTAAKAAKRRKPPVGESGTEVSLLPIRGSTSPPRDR